MESAARHPGYQLQLIAAAIIAAQSAAAGAGIERFRWPLLPGAIVIFIIGANALSRGTEGYTTVIGLACVLQAALTVVIVSAAIAESLRHRHGDQSRRT